MIFTSFISKKYANLKKKVGETVDHTFEQIFRGGMFSLIMVTLIWIAVFFYVIFYYTYVPAPSYVRPIHLQVEPCEDASGKDCAFPSAHVRLTRRQQLLMMGQQYKFYVHLDMPESPINKRLGMFMVCVQLTDKNGFLTSQSCRSNMLHYHSDLLYQMKVILLSPLFIFGAKEEQQTLVFELYSDFEEDQNHPVTDVYVEVQARSIEIYSASLHINAHLTGMRYFMYYWPVTSAFLGITSNICFIFFVTWLSFYHKFFVDSGPAKAVKVLSRKGDNTDDLSAPDSAFILKSSFGIRYDNDPLKGTEFEEQKDKEPKAESSKSN